MTAFCYSAPAANLGLVIPSEMKALPIWLLWKAIQKDGKPKPDKVAFWANGKVRTGKQGGAIDIANLATFEIAMAAYGAIPGRFAGVGVALLPEMGIGALDLDDCLNLNGGLNADLEVRRILKAAEGCYIEKSPSGCGIRVFGSTDGFKQITERGFEAYAQGRFMTVTGDCVMNEGAWRSVDRGVAAMRHEIASLAAMSLNSQPKKNRGRPSEIACDPETPPNIQRVRNALAAVDPDVSYPDWLAVLMAIKSTEWDCAEVLAREWSERGEKFFDGSFTKAWESIDPAGGITLGTLFHKASTSGWQPTQALPPVSGLVTKRTGTEATEERDVLNGRLFADQWRGRMLRVDQTGDVLLFEKGAGWVKAGDPVNATRKAARETLAQMSEEAAAMLKVGETEKSQKINKHVAASSTVLRMDAMAAVGQCCRTTD